MIHSQNQNGSQHVRVGKTLLAQMEADQLRIVRTWQGLWMSEGGQEWVRLSKMYLVFRIELACRELDIASSTALIYETRKWLKRQPELWRNDLSQKDMPF